MGKLNILRKALNKYFAEFELISIFSSNAKQKEISAHAMKTVVDSREQIAKRYDIPLCVFMNEMRIVLERRFRVYKIGERPNDIESYIEQVESILSAMSKNWELYQTPSQK